jgi:hypothetical protein
MSLNAISSLQQSLRHVLDNFDIPKLRLGDTQAIIVAVENVKKVFEGCASAEAPKERAYQAALKFIREQKLEDDEYDFIAAAINTPIKEAGGKRIISSPRFGLLINFYTKQIKHNELWRLTWYWLLLSYFQLEVGSHVDEQTKKNATLLQKFLNDSHTHFTQQQGYIPQWAKTLQEHSNILTETPCDRYAEGVFQGILTEIEQIKEQLGIPPQSWFWHQLTLSIVKYVTNLRDDKAFKSYIPKLISYLEKYQGFKDEAIKLILERYYQCTDKSPHPALRDYVIRPDVWKNPKLRNSGIASKWRNVNENIWRMVLSWVTREHLRMFFEIISGRNGARKDRFEFWSQYLEQISFTKLVFGQETKLQKLKNPEIAKLFNEEKDVSALLSSNNSELDAFIIEIKDYIFVEFSMNGNAAFIYEKSKIPFKLDALRMNDETSGNGLKSAQNNKIIHNNNWQDSAKNRLMNLGIYPDVPIRRY